VEAEEGSARVAFVACQGNVADADTRPDPSGNLRIFDDGRDEQRCRKGLSTLRPKVSVIFRKQHSRPPGVACGSSTAQVRCRRPFAEFGVAAVQVFAGVLRAPRGPAVAFHLHQLDAPALCFQAGRVDVRRTSSRRTSCRSCSSDPQNTPRALSLWSGRGSPYVGSRCRDRCVSPVRTRPSPVAPIAAPRVA
jgi:hypothetical protein